MSFEYFAEEGFPLGTPLHHQQHLFAGSNDEEIAPSTAPLGPQNQQPDSAYQLYPYDTDVSPSTDPDFFAAVVSPSSSPLPAAHHNYDYLLKRAHLNSLLLPIDQLNLLSLRLAIRLPTLLLSTSNGGIDLEERTVNPRHLFNDQKLTASLLLPALLTLFSSYGHLLNIALHDLVATNSVALNANSTTLPGHSAISTVDNSNMGPITSTTQSVALSVTTSPRITHNNRHSIAGMPAGASASTLALSGGAGHPGSQLYLESESNFAMTAASAPTLKGQSPLSLRRESVTEVTPRFDFVMNDECFNAIHYWLNNAQGELAGPGAEMALENPTGIMKMSPPAHHRRRNSIHMGPPPLTANSIKKKRRKSYNEELVVPILGGTRLPSQRRELESQSLATITGTSSELVIEEDDSAEAFHYESTKNPLTSIGSGSNSGYISGLGTSAGLNVAPPRPLSGSLDNAEFKNGSLSSPGRGDGYLSGPLANLRNSGAPEAPVTPVMPKKTTKSPVIEDDDENEDGKPFPCPECLKQFKRLEHLKRHIRSVHLNIRPFHCKYCEKKFSRSDNLAQHLKTHYKTLPNGNTTIVLGNPNVFNRGKRK